MLPVVLRGEVVLPMEEVPTMGSRGLKSRRDAAEFHFHFLKKKFTTFGGSGRG